MPSKSPVSLLLRNCVIYFCSCAHHVCNHKNFSPNEFLHLKKQSQDVWRVLILPSDLCLNSCRLSPHRFERLIFTGIPFVWANKSHALYSCGRNPSVGGQGSAVLRSGNREHCKADQLSGTEMMHTPLSALIPEGENQAGA